MYDWGELVTLATFVVVVAGVLLWWGRIKQAPHAKLLLLSVVALTGASLFTLVEHLIWYTVFNFLEHLFNLISVWLLLVWCTLLRNDLEGDDSA